jgi:hypothetical protein
MKFEIKNRWNGSVLFECEALSLKIAVEIALSKKINLSYADLSGVDLSYTDLSRANLSRADLSRANLSRADLSRADLSCADLSGAKLIRADLSRANLSCADLSYADLSYADLSGTKKDFFSKLTLAKNEAAALYKALLDGRIDGSCYEGECACFVGTLANVKHVKPAEICELSGIRMDSDSPVERWFMAIRKGDTPENHPVSAITADWMREWAKENEITLPTREVIWK